MLGEPLDEVLPLGAEEERQPLRDEQGEQPGTDLPADPAGPPVASLATDDDQRPRPGQRPAQPPEGAEPADVEDQVVAGGAVEVVVGRVVEDVMGAQGAHQRALASARHPGDRGTECRGELDRVAADSAGGSDDQHALPGLQPADVGHRLERGDPRDRRDGGLLHVRARPAAARAWPPWLRRTARRSPGRCRRPRHPPGTGSRRRRRRPHGPRRRARAPGTSAPSARRPAAPGTASRSPGARHRGPRPAAATSTRTSSAAIEGMSISAVRKISGGP